MLLTRDTNCASRYRVIGGEGNVLFNDTANRQDYLAPVIDK